MSVCECVWVCMGVYECVCDRIFRIGNRSTFLAPPIFELSNTGTIHPLFWVWEKRHAFSKSVTHFHLSGSSMYRPHSGTRPNIFSFFGEQFGKDYTATVKVRESGYPLVVHVDLEGAPSLSRTHNTHEQTYTIYFHHADASLSEYINDMKNAAIVFSPSGACLFLSHILSLSLSYSLSLSLSLSFLYISYSAQIQIDPTHKFSFLAPLFPLPYLPHLLGNGIDCHRTWEAVMLGNVAVVQSSPLNELYITHSLFLSFPFSCYWYGDFLSLLSSLHLSLTLSYTLTPFQDTAICQCCLCAIGPNSQRRSSDIIWCSWKCARTIDGTSSLPDTGWIWWGILRIGGGVGGLNMENGCEIDCVWISGGLLLFMMKFSTDIWNGGWFQRTRARHSHRLIRLIWLKSRNIHPFLFRYISRANLFGLHICANVKWKLQFILRI